MCEHNDRVHDSLVCYHHSVQDISCTSIPFTSICDNDVDDPAFCRAILHLKARMEQRILAMFQAEPLGPFVARVPDEIDYVR